MGRESFDVEKTVIQLVMTDDVTKKRELAKKIFDVAYEEGVYPSSIHEFYMARGRGEFSGFTVPAINLRSMTYDLARAIFRVAKKNDSGTFIFEIAKSEIGYTDQPPIEYASMVMAAATRENYFGPVFIQGDHFQVNAAKFKENPDKEIEGLQALIEDAISSGFYNIDIDSSTLVDLSKPDLKEQQLLNYESAQGLRGLSAVLSRKGSRFPLVERSARLGIRILRLKTCTHLWPASKTSWTRIWLALVRSPFKLGQLTEALCCLTGQSRRSSLTLTR
jgi:hypothetical protein